LGKIIYSQRGGIRLGKRLASYGYSYPLCRLSVFNDGLQVEYPNVKDFIYWNDIVSIHWHGFLCFGGIKFKVQKRKDIDAYVFLFFRPKKLLKVIAAARQIVN